MAPFDARLEAGLKPTLRNLYADGAAVIVVFDGDGAALDGSAYHNIYAWFLEMEEGKVKKARAFFDAIASDDLWRRVKPTKA